MATSYKKIYNSFLKRIEDKDLPNFSEDEQNQIMAGYLDAAIGYIELDGLEIISDLSNRDNELAVFKDDLTNAEIEVVAMYMVAAWYEPKINSLQTTLLFIGSKDEKWTSQKDYLNMMKENRDSWKLEAKKYFRNYGYKNNSYLGGS